jgi:hypothetical protein
MDSPRKATGPQPAISWASVSTGPQAENDKASIPSQLESNRRNAAAVGAYIAHEIVVPGHSRYYSTVEECAADMRAEGITAFDEIVRLWDTRAAKWLLIRDADRIARRLRMGVEFVERTYEAGMKIYSDVDGELRTYRQALNWIASAGLRAESNVMFLVDGRAKAAPKLAEKGLHAQGVPRKTHRLIRDEKHKRIGVEVDPTMSLVLHDAVSLLLDGVPYPKLDAELLARFGHRRADGKPYSPLAMYSLIFHPFSFGHTAINYSSRALRKNSFPRLGLWIFEPGHEIPEGVQIEYGSHPSVFDAATTAQIIAEYERRAGRYKSQPKDKQWGSLLYYCDECKRPMAFHVSKGVQRYGKHKEKVTSRDGSSNYLRCVTHVRPSPRYPHCSQTKMLREDAARAAAEDWLMRTIVAHDASAPDHDEAAQRRAAELRAVEADADRLKGIIDRLIVQRATAPEGTDTLYVEQIAAHQAQREAAQARIASLMAAVSRDGRAMLERSAAVDEVRAGDVASFWAQAPAAINRKLRALLNPLRFAVKEGKVIAMMVEPPRYQTRPRKPRRKA